jgi:Kyakuja-Dileera-Zisupton transposase
VALVFALTPPAADKVAPRYTVGVGVDACCKANQFTSAGKAVKHLQPHDCKNFGEANRLTAAYTKYRDGAMLLDDVIIHGLRGPPCDEARQPAAAIGATAAAATQEEEDGHGPACDTDIHCARQAATAVKGTDVHGIVGMACSHGVPVRQSYVNMLTPENFGMYLLIFSSILPRLRTVRDVYVDFGCKLRVTWARYLAQERARPGGEEGPLSTQQSPHLSRVRILVNWMHASSHKLSCQLTNSARYAVNAARRVGEMMEQTWAMFKVSWDFNYLYVTYVLLQ